MLVTLRFAGYPFVAIKFEQPIRSTTNRQNWPWSELTLVIG